jgi:hypothetical protein
VNLFGAEVLVVDGGLEVVILCVQALQLVD